MTQICQVQRREALITWASPYAVMKPMARQGYPLVTITVTAVSPDPGS